MTCKVEFSIFCDEIWILLFRKLSEHVLKTKIDTKTQKVITTALFQEPKPTPKRRTRFLIFGLIFWKIFKFFEVQNALKMRVCEFVVNFFFQRILRKF